jgi:tetratricopeptide (TPR) repeat protein
VLGRFDEADTYARISEDLADDDDVDCQVIWRSLRAKLLARAGQAEAALSLAQGANAMAAGTDDIEQQADALRDLGEVYVLIGRAREEEQPLLDALRLYDAKGDVVQARQLRQRLATQSPA